ncbi:neuropilin-1a-like [Haliotis rubra]|uniref:neuropilin-1a-like n=1 Tax=Haliotis rubra TaxID=36100 RepID=UPI001EE504E5|nr:neuropilin-1a-like [Haliotis rubra]
MSTFGPANKCLCLCFGVMLLVYQSACQGSIDCGFESQNDFCGWNTSRVPWQRSNTGTETPGTGPDLGRNGYYVYLDADDFKDSGNIVQPGRCVMLSPAFNTTSRGGCFEFWYHMKGSGIGNLSATVVEDSPTSSIMKWERKGSQGSQWNCGFFTLNGNKNNIKIELTAWSGDNILGDIAIDDLKLLDAACTESCVDVTTTPTTTSSLISSTTLPASSSQNTTASPVDATTPSSGLSDLTRMIIYISVIPVGVLFIGVTVACICYRSRKGKEVYKPDIEVNHTNEGFDENGEEVYHELDDNTMLENAHNDYTVPTSTLPSNKDGDTIQYAYSTSGAANAFRESKAEDPDAGAYTRLQRPTDEDAASVDSNYLEPVAGPDDGSSGIARNLDNRDSLDTFHSGIDRDGGSVPHSPDWLNQNVPTPKQCGPLYLTAIHKP